MAKFPGELEDLKLSEDQETELRHFLVSELQRSDDERLPFIDNLKEEVDAYEAPQKSMKSYPWRGASNLTVPVIGSMVDTIFPRLHATVYGSSTIITVEEWPGDLSDHAKAWEDVLEWSLRNELEIEKVSNSWFMEAIIHGTSVVKVFWDRIERTITEYDDDGKILSTNKELLSNQPAMVHVPLEDFYIPYTAQSIKEAEWVAHRIRTTWGQLKNKEENGLYKDVERIINYTQPDSPEYERHREDIEEHQPMWADEYEIYEVWADYDLGEGIEPILVTIELDSGTLLRTQANPYKHRDKPFREIVYFPRHDRFYGMGMSRQLMPIQEEISTIHNQRIDNATLANTRMWKVVSGSRADQSFQGAAPGLKVLVDDPSEIAPMEMGDVKRSSFEGEQLAMQLAQQRAGVTDFVQGIDFGKGGGRQTATQTVAMMQEARTRFNWTLEQARSAIHDISVWVTGLYGQFGSDDEDKFVNIVGEKTQLVIELLSGGELEGSASDVLGLQVTASSAAVNKSIEQQSLIALMQMTQQQTLEFEMPLIQIILDPTSPENVKEWAQEKIEGSRALLRRVMETADVRNTSEILGTAADIRFEGPQGTPAPPAAQPPPGAAIPGAQPPGIPGLEALGGPV